MLIDAKWVGNTYDYHYTMADFPDNTGFRNMAAIYLSIDGLTESFPLPGENRRWVVNHLDGEISIQNLIEKIYTRSGFRLSESECTMHSNFRIHEYESTKICDGNIILLGDATHIMSPIGGQAMSLHWIHASRLGKLITQILQKNITEIKTYIIQFTSSSPNAMVDKVTSYKFCGKINDTWKLINDKDSYQCR